MHREISLEDAYSMLYQEGTVVVIILFDHTASFTTIALCSLMNNSTDHGKGNHKECRYIGHFYRCFRIQLASTSWIVQVADFKSQT